MSVAATRNTPSQTFRCGDLLIQSGIWHSFDKFPWSGDRTKTHFLEERVNFPVVYPQPPLVQVALTSIDCNHEKNLRVNALATKVDVSGFTARVEWWANTHLYGASLSWTAYGHAVNTDQQEIEEEREKKEKKEKEKKERERDGLEKGKEYPQYQDLKVFTVSAWVFPIGQGRIFDKVTAGCNDGWLLDFYPGTLPRVQAAPDRLFNALSPVPEKKWCHLSFVFDGLTAVLYVNGVENQRKEGKSPMDQNKHPLRVGFASTGEASFAGDIEHAYLFKKALSADEVHNLYLEHYRQYFP